MTVLFLVDTISARGGSERACINAANLLAEEETCQVLILSIKGPSFPAYPLHENVKLIGLNYRAGWHFRLSMQRFLWQFRQILKQEQVEAIVAVEIINSVFVDWLFKFKLYSPHKIQWIAWEHFNFTVNLGLSIRDRYRKVVAAKADDIIVLTDQDKSMWQQQLEVKAKLHTVYNVTPFPTQENPYLIHDNTRSVIIAVGRLTYQKGWDRLLDIWKLFVTERPDLAALFPLRIIGSGEDLSALEQQIKTNDLSTFVRIVQNTNEIESWYQKAKLLVMTSRFEGLPMVLIEAQSFGIPILAYDCVTGPRDVITSESGWLIPENDSHAFVQQLVVSLEKESLIIESGNAWKASQRFHSQSVLKAWKQVFNPKKD